MTGKKISVFFSAPDGLSFWEDIYVIPSIGHTVKSRHGRTYTVVSVLHDYDFGEFMVKLEASE